MLCLVPAFLKLNQTAVTQRGVQPTVVVEGHPSSVAIGDVARPDLIGCSRGEIALHQVRGDGQMVLAVSGDDKLAFTAPKHGPSGAPPRPSRWRVA